MHQLLSLKMQCKHRGRWRKEWQEASGSLGSSGPGPDQFVSDAARSPLDLASTPSTDVAANPPKAIMIEGIEYGFYCPATDRATS